MGVRQAGERGPHTARWQGLGGVLTPPQALGLSAFLELQITRLFRENTLWATLTLSDVLTFASRPRTGVFLNVSRTPGKVLCWRRLGELVCSSGESSPHRYYFLLPVSFGGSGDASQ